MSCSSWARCALAMRARTTLARLTTNVATIRLDKVLTSRLLRALDAGDPFAAVHRMPGPEPLRRLLRACSARGAGRDELARAEVAVDRFDRLINGELGDRQALGKIVVTVES